MGGQAFSIGGLTQLGGFVQAPLEAFGLALARALGLLLLLPVFSRLGLRGTHRTAVAGALSVPLVPILAAGLAADPVGGARLLLLTVKEGFIGLLLGILFAAPFWVAEAAGELIDQQRGARGNNSLPDPTGDEQVGPTGTLLVLTLLTVFFVSGGLHWMLDGLYASYAVWPALELVPHLAADTGTQMLGVLDGILGAGFLLASPLVVAMVLAEFSLALVSRFAPSLNVFDLSMSLKGLIQVVGLPVYAVFLIGYLKDGLAPLMLFGDTVRRLGGG